MKFAHEVIDLMAAYPGREFRMVQIVRHIANGRKLDRRERHAVRVGVWRVLQVFAESGTVIVRAPDYTRGGPAFYRWKVSHEPIAE